MFKQFIRNWQHRRAVRKLIDAQRYVNEHSNVWTCSTAKGGTISWQWNGEKWVKL